MTRSMLPSNRVHSGRARFLLGWCATATSLLAAILVTPTGAAPQVVSSPGPVLSAQALDQIQTLMDEKASRTERENRIDSQLLFRYKQSRQLLRDNLRSMSVATTQAADGREVVDVTATGAMSLVSDVQSLGADVLFADDRMLRLQTPIDLIEEIAALPGVLFVQPALYPRTQSAAHAAARESRSRPTVASRSREGWLGRLRAAIGIRRPSAVTAVDSEGDTTHKATIARSTFGVSGAGIKVGVMSSGVDGLAASQSAGALGAVTVLPGQAGQGNEGTAMLEIVHDLAPSAQLYFAAGGPTITQFATNIYALQAAGCQIIVDDVGFANEAPFQDGQAASVISTTNGGIVAQAVKDVSAAGVLYFSSAANSGNLTSGISGTWEGDFADSGFTFGTTPDNGRRGIANRFGFFAGLPFPTNQIVQGATSVSLFWADPLGHSSNDYDLYVIDDGTGLVRCASTNTQNGTQDPFEFCPSAGAAGGDIYVIKYSGSARYLHVEATRGILTFATAGSTHGHPTTTAATSFSVAATPARTSQPGSCGIATPPSGPYPNPFNSSNRVECFSSDGPRRIFFNGDGTAITPGNFLLATNGGQVLIKPDFTAADGVSVSGAGFVAGSALDDVQTPFFGTSAAAPHAAAIAALVWSRSPSQPASAVKAALLASTIDVMAAGVDRDSGAGILMADKAVARMSAPAMSLDGPASQASLKQPFNTGGWAVDLGAAGGTGVDAIHVYAFPIVNGVVGAGIFVSQATLGGQRNDVAAVFGSQFANSGFNFLMNGLNPGQYYVGVYVHSSVTASFNQQQFVPVTILPSGPTSNPAMSLDGPANNSTIQQPFITGGWAVDLGAPSGTGVDAIHVWAFPVVNGVTGAGQFVAAAQLGGTRPDVAAVFGNQFAKAGFNFLMTGLSPGQYYVGVYVHSSVTGTFNQQQFALVTILK
jgi:subtilisin family serine protease